MGTGKVRLRGRVIRLDGMRAARRRPCRGDALKVLRIRFVVGQSQRSDRAAVHGNRNGPFRRVAFARAAVRVDDGDGKSNRFSGSR